MENILSVRQLSYTYEDGTQALKNIDLSIPRGKRVVLLGHNGAGKSTLMLALNGLLEASGKVQVDDIESIYKDACERLLNTTGLVFQDPDSQIFNTFIEQELSYGLLNLGLPHDEIVTRINRVCDEFNLNDLMEKPIQHMSFGQKKRIAVASIIAMDPQLIMLDEPTAGLDPLYQKIVLHMLNQLIEQGKGVLVSTHDIELAFEWADYIIVMDQGRILSQGTPVDVFKIWSESLAVGMHLPLLYEILKQMDPSEALLEAYALVPSGQRREWVTSRIQAIK